MENWIPQTLWKILNSVENWILENLESLDEFTLIFPLEMCWRVFQQVVNGPFLLLILFSYAFCAICARSSGIMYAYCVYHTKRRRVLLLSLFYANFFPESLFLSHSSSFHHEKNAPKSYWKGFPSSLLTIQFPHISKH